MKQIIIKFTAALLLLLASSSCGSMKIANLARQMELVSVDSFELKGLSGLVIEGKVTNSSSSQIKITEGEIDLYLVDRRVASLSQIGELVFEKGEAQPFRSLWKIKNLDPALMLSLSSKMQTGNYSGMTTDLSLRVQAKRFDQNISRKNLNLEDLMTNLNF